MVFTNGLYYPWIDVHDESWLKNVALFWDNVSTIVPESVEHPYTRDITKALSDEGIIRPFRVNPDLEEIKNITPKAIEYLHSVEGMKVLAPGDYIHVDKMDSRLRHLLELDDWAPPHLHREKLASELLYEMRDSFKGGDWIEAGHVFGSYYMTLLANEIAEHNRLSLITNVSDCNDFANKLRTDDFFSFDTIPGHRHRGPFRTEPKYLVDGFKANCLIEGFSINPDTDIKRIIKFRKQYSDELTRFRVETDQLLSSVSSGGSLDDVRHNVGEAYETIVKPAISDLGHALRSNRIDIETATLAGITAVFGNHAFDLYFSNSPLLGLLVTAGISVVVLGARYNERKEQVLRDNPYTYLYQIQRRLR